MRRTALHGTELAQATCGTIRNKLLKIGAHVRITVRRIHFASACPCQEIFRHVLASLTLIPLRR